MDLDQKIGNPFDEFDDTQDALAPSGAGDFAAPSMIRKRNAFDEFDQHPDAQPNKRRGDWTDRLIDGFSVDNALEKTRALNDGERQGIDLGQPWADPAPEKPLPAGEKPEPSFWAQAWEGLGPENARAMADSMDHFALMSDDPSYQQMYAGWAKALRQAADSGASAKAIYQGFGDVHGIGDFWGYSKEVVGRNLGMMAPSLAGAVIGGYAGGKTGGAVGGKTGGRIGAAAGAVGGSILGMSHLHIADMRRALMHEGVEGPKLAEYTNYGAAALVGLDMMFPTLTALKLTGAGNKVRANIAVAAARRLAQGGAMRTPAEFLRQYGKQILTEALVVEGTTELAQEALTQLGSKAIAGKEVTGEDVQKFATETAPEVLLQTVLTAGAISTPGSIIEARARVNEAKQLNQFPGDRFINPEQQPPVSITDILKGLNEEEAPPAVVPPQVSPKDEGEAESEEELPGRYERAVDVIQFLRGHGGLKPDGELKAIDAKRYPGLVSRKGLNVDRARELLVEGGYLEESGPDQPAITTPQDVYDLIGRAMGGERVVPRDMAESDRGYFADMDRREAEATLADMEATVVIPQIAELDALSENNAASTAYAKLSTSERNEVIERAARGNENIDDIMEELAIRSAGSEAVLGLAVRAGATPDEVNLIRTTIERNPKGVGKLVSALMNTARATDGLPQGSSATVSGPAYTHPGELTQSQLVTMGREQLIAEGARVGVTIPSTTSADDAARILRQAYADPGVMADMGATPLTGEELTREGEALAALTPNDLIEQIQVAREAAVNDGPAGMAHWRDEGRRLAAQVRHMKKTDAITVASTVLGRPLTSEEKANRGNLADAVAASFTGERPVRAKNEAGLGPVTITDDALTSAGEAKANRIVSALTRVTQAILPCSVGVVVEKNIDLAQALRDAMNAVVKVNAKVAKQSRQAFASPAGQRFVATFEPDSQRPEDIYIEFFPEAGGPIAGSATLTFHGLGDPKVHGHGNPRYEVGYVEVEPEHRGRGLANAFYDAVESHLGIKLQPSGLLHKDGYRLWQRRDPAAIRGWVLDPNEGDYISPFQIDMQLGFLRKHRSALARAKGDVRKILNYDEMIKRYEGLWDQVPADLKEQSALDRMFMLAGRRAATAPLGSLSAAQAMEDKGRKPERIFRDTGWLRGPDGKWRWEIPDNDARVHEANWRKYTSASPARPAAQAADRSLLRRLFGAKGASVIPASGPIQRSQFGDRSITINIPLPELLDHPKLFAAYPFLRQMRVNLFHGPRVLPEGALRSSSTGSGVRYMPIEVKASNPVDFLSVLLHELQHYIQSREGFAEGAADTSRKRNRGDRRSVLGKVDSARKTKPQLYDPSQNSYLERAKAGEFSLRWRFEKLASAASPAEGTALSLLDLYERAKADPNDTRIQAEIQADEERLEQELRADPDTYARSYGEWEARKVQERLGMSAEDRRRAFPLADMPDDLRASRWLTPSYQEAYDEIMRRALVIRTMREKWKTATPVGDGVSVIRADEDHLYYVDEGATPPNPKFPIDIAHVTVNLYPTVGGGTVRLSQGFQELPYARQKEMMDAIARDARSRNVRLTVEEWQGADAFEFWRRYDPSQVASDPRLYRAELEKRIKDTYGADAQLVLYGDINPETGEVYDNAYEPYNVYYKNEESKSTDYIVIALRKIVGYRAEQQALDAKSTYNDVDDRYDGALGREIMELEAAIADIRRNPGDQGAALRRSIAELRALQRGASSDATWSDLNDAIVVREMLLGEGQPIDVIDVPNRVVEDILPQTSGFDAPRGIDQEMFYQAGIVSHLRNMGITGDAMLSASSYRGFFSQAIRMAEGLRQNVGTGQQFWKQISSAPGVKQAELDWMGLEEFLKDKPSITKAEVLEFMRAHQVELDEKVLGEGSLRKRTSRPVTAEELGKIVDFDGAELRSAIQIKIDDDPNGIAYIVQWSDAPQEYHVLDQFGDTISSGRTYAEAEHQAVGLATGQDMATKFGGYKVPGGENYRELLIRLPSLEGKHRTEAESARLNQLTDELVPLQDRVFDGDDSARARMAEVEAERDAILRAGKAKYTSKHFQDQELVHLRIDDRTGPNGEKVLFINEVQSDLHQTGRRHGYGRSKAELDAIVDQLEKEWHAHVQSFVGRPVREATQSPEGIALRRRLDDAIIAANSPVVPDAPFKGDLWLELALKRALLYASENGYDAVSWARSDQIAGAVGAKPEKLALQYDQKIGRFLDKYTRKWGGKVEAGAPSSPRDAEIEARLAELGVTIDDLTYGPTRFPREQQMEIYKLIEERNALKTAVDFTPGEQSNPILRITPEMRASIPAGQPLFALSRNLEPTPEEAELLILGQADLRNNLIRIGLRANELEAAQRGGSAITQMARTLFHEAVELFRGAGMFTKREWSAMEKAAIKRGWITPELRANYTELYGDRMSPEALEKLLIKEAIADAYADWHFSDESMVAEPKGLIAKAWRRGSDFIRRIGSMVSGMGFTRPEDVFRRIDRGELARRYEAQFGVPQEATQDSDTAGVVRAGVLPDAPGFAPRAGVHPVIGLADIIFDFRQALGQPVRQGRLDPQLRRAARRQGAQLYGQYNRGTGITRLAVSNDFDAMTHEGGHHLELRYGAPLAAIMQRYAHELGPLAAAIGYQPTDVREGFAEYFRRYVTAPTLAQARAPGFDQAFETFLRVTDPDMLGRLENIQSAYEAFLTGSPIEIGRANQTVLIGRDTAVSRWYADVQREGFIDATSDRLHFLYYAAVAKNHGWWMATNRLLRILDERLGRRVTLHAEDNPNKLLRRISHTTSWAMRALKDGMPLRAQPNGNGHGIHEVLATAFGGTQPNQWTQDQLENFGDYLIARRAVHLYVLHNPALRQHIAQFVAANPQLNYLLARLPSNAVSELDHAPTLESLDVQLRKLVDHEAQNPQYNQAAEQYYEFNRSIIRFLAEKGLISTDEMQQLLIERDYAPFQRDRSDIEMAGERRASQRPEVNGPLANKHGVYRAIRGSSRDIINPIQSTVQHVYEIMLRAAFNDTLQAMDRLSRAAGAPAGSIFERLPEHEARQHEVSIREALRTAGRAAGMSPTDITMMVQNVEHYLGPNATANLFSLQQASENGERIVWFYENGKPIPAQLADGTLGKMMFEAFTTLGRRSPDMWMKMLSMPAAVMRFGVTNAWEFIIRNIFVDAFVAPVNSPHATPFVTQASGLRQILTGGYYMQMYNRYGGMMGGEAVAGLSDQGIERDMHMLRDLGYKVRRPRNLWELMKMGLQLGEFAETATRVGIFRAAMESARADGLGEQAAAIEASHAAHDVMDFSRHGSRTELLRRSVTFLNAMIQGTDRYIRSLTAQGDRGSAFVPWLRYRLQNGQGLSQGQERDLAQAAKAWAYTALVFGGMSMLARALSGDDDDLEEIPDRLRATHWIISLNGVIHLLPKSWDSFLPNDTPLRLPKGFETAWVANAVERALDAWQKDDPTAFEGWLGDTWETVKPPTNFVALDLIYGLLAGKDMQTGRDIIPAWEKDLARKEQYGPYTSEAAKLIGKNLGVAPYYVDFVGRGLGASLARDVVALTDGVTNFLDGTGPALGIEDYPIARRFSYNTGRSSRSLNEYYNQYFKREGLGPWFWDAVRTDAASYSTAGKTYALLKGDRERSARASDYYETLSPDQKVYATLSADFKGDVKSKYKRLHPIENAHEGISVVNKMMKEVINSQVETGRKGDEVVKLDREQTYYARNELGHIRKAIAQNNLHILGVPGWAHRTMSDLDARLKVLKEVSGPVYDELLRRLKKEHFVDPKHLKTVWPQARERVLADREDAQLGDLYQAIEAE